MQKATTQTVSKSRMKQNPVYISQQKVAKSREFYVAVGFYRSLQANMSPLKLIILILERRYTA